MMIRIEDLRCREDVAGRMRVDEKVVNEYRHELCDGAVFPPIDVFVVDGEYVVVDGYHRLEAHRRAGRVEIDCRLNEGDLTAARLFAACANQTHGLRRNLEDKRLVITTLLDDAEMAAKGDAAIAHALGVNERFVANVRRAMESGDERQLEFWVRRRGASEGVIDEGEVAEEAPSAAALPRMDPAALGTFPAIEVTLPADLPVDEIANIPVGDLAEDMCVLMIRTTWQRLSDAEALIDTWKFVWQGAILARLPEKLGKRQRGVTVFATRGHAGLSGPDALIERAYEHGAGIAVFHGRPGWRSWGLFREEANTSTTADLDADKAKRGLRTLRERVAARSLSDRETDGEEQ